MRGESGVPIIDEREVETSLTNRWRDLLRQIDDDVIIWSRTYRRKFGVAPVAVIEADSEDEAEEDDDPYAVTDDR